MPGGYGDSGGGGKSKPATRPKSEKSMPKKKRGEAKKMAAIMLIKRDPSQKS